MIDATIVSCGPSAAGFRPSRGDGIIVAVNRAIDVVSCDWWATGELADPATWSTYLARLPSPRIGIVTSDDQVAKAPRTSVDGAPLLVERFDSLWPTTSRRRFSAPLAVAWALRRWPGVVRLVGFDMTGNAYAGGKKMYAVRPMRDQELEQLRLDEQVRARWEIERAAMEALEAANPGRLVWG